MRCCWLGWPGWSPGRRQWRLGSTCRSAPTDADQADISRERRELAADPKFEQDELTELYARRGLDRELAATIAERLMAADPLAAMSAMSLACSQVVAGPLQAAVVSAVSFAVGAALPLALIALAPIGVRISGHGAGRAGVAGPAGSGWRPAWRCPSRAAAAGDGGRGLAMALTALIDQLVGATGL
jgi:hypothetical protein